MITALLMSLLFGASIFYALSHYLASNGKPKESNMFDYLTFIVIALFIAIILGGVTAMIMNHIHLLSPN